VKLRFYNSYTGQVESFEPLEPGKLRMYHCGPTVYKRAHIGNYRAFLFADLLRRYFDALGFEVTQVMNLTDVGHLTDDADEGEDKLEAEARRAKLDPWQIVEQVSAQFFADLHALSVRPAHHYPKATDHIPEMVTMIETLIAKGHAYRVGDNVYFDVHSFPRYGKLSGNKIAELEAGARLEINQEKRHPADFALWKSDPNHLMKWDTVFGPDGFPGWHIECSAMSMKYLGDRFDIHTGGEDNVFPHHECEIAQSESATGQPFVNLWMHTRFLQVDGGKMSKSLGNVYSLDDLTEHGFGPMDLRFLILRGHYRTQLNFTWEALRGAAEARNSLYDWRGRLEAVARTSADVEACGPEVQQAEAVFDAAMADDLNTPEAVAAIFTLRNQFMQQEFSSAGAAQALQLLAKVDDILGLFDSELKRQGLSDAEVDTLIEQRGLARADQDWARADQIRDQLAAAHIVLEDQADGARWHRA
jgi:cysteinyl-tRNA synthetase